MNIKNKIKIISLLMVIFLVSSNVTMLEAARPPARRGYSSKIPVFRKHKPVTSWSKKTQTIAKPFPKIEQNLRTIHTYPLDESQRKIIKCPSAPISKKRPIPPFSNPVPPLKLLTEKPETTTSQLAKLSNPVPPLNLPQQTPENTPSKSLEPVFLPVSPVVADRKQRRIYSIKQRYTDKDCLELVRKNSETIPMNEEDKNENMEQPESLTITEEDQNATNNQQPEQTDEKEEDIIDENLINVDIQSNEDFDSDGSYF